MTLRALITAASLLILVAPATAYAQADDPCLGVLAGADLERYDALVSDYFGTLDTGDHAAQLAVLDDLDALCDANLRLGVLRGNAYAALDRCEEAASAYFRVLDLAPSWPHRENAESATGLALEGLTPIRGVCVAQITVQCAPKEAEVRAGGRPPKSCGSTVAVPAGPVELMISAPGMQSITKEYEFKAGSNFVELEPLQPLSKSGQVRVECESAGTRILLDGHQLACPLTTSLPPGEVGIEAIRPDGTRWTGVATILEDTTTSIVIPASGGAAVSSGGGEAPPQAGEGTVILVCNPSGAKVTITGGGLSDPVETDCPLSMPLPAGEYTAEITAKGFTADSRTLNVSGGSITKQEITLEDEGGIGLWLRATGGILLVPERDEAAGTIESILNGLAKLGVFLPFDVDGSELEIGIEGRVGFGEDVVGSALLWINWAIRAESVALLFGGGFGYGTLGVHPCPGDLTCTETEVASLVYGAGLGIEIGLGEWLSLLIDGDLMIGAGFAIDVTAGFGIRL